MADFAEAVRSRTGTKFYDGASKLVALDPSPRKTLLVRETFDTTTGIFEPMASTGVNVGTNPVTNGSAHIYRTSQVTLEGGCLTFTAVKEGAQWYSGYADTRNRYGAVGPISIYMKFLLPSTMGPGAWPSVWGMHSPHANWPTSGEDDFFEWVWDHQDRLYYTTHFDDPYGSGTHKALPDYTLPTVKNYSSGLDPTVWHELEHIVRPGIGMEWYLDGNLKMTTNGYPHPPQPFDTDLKFIANLAVGATNGFVSLPDGTTVSGSKFKIDTFEVSRLRAPATTIGGLNYQSVTQRADGTDVKLVLDNPPGALLFPGSTGSTGGGTGGTGGSGLPPAGPHALWNPTTSPTRVPIDWSTAVINNTDVVQNSYYDANIGGPYVALSDSGVRTYWTDSSTAGRLTIRSNNYGAGTYTVVCPAGAQPSVSGSDGPIQIVQPDGTWVDCYAVTGNHITWNGNTGSCSVDGIIFNKTYKTVTGWPVGTISSFTKAGFAACGASVAAGAITAEDKQLGYIAHALALCWANAALRDGPIMPATRDDTGTYGSTTTGFPNGALLAIPPTSRGGPAKPSNLGGMWGDVWDAMQTYGGYTMDRTSSGLVIRTNTVNEPGVTTTLSSADFPSPSTAKQIFNAARWITKGKPTLGSAHA